MGNTQPSNHPRLKVYIDVENEFYNSGSVINGTVFVDAQENFSFDALYLRIQGDEFCQWFEGSSKNRRKFTGNESFYIQEEMLFRYERGLHIGKYMYPFSIEISQNIPGTYLSPDYVAHIRYKMVAHLVNFSDKKKRHYFETPLIIRQPFRQEVSQYEGSSTTSPITCCCNSQGEVTLKVHFKSNVCFEGEKIPLEIDCNNTRGEKRIDKFVMQLVQYTFISANNGTSRTYRKIIDTQNCNRVVEKGQEVNEIDAEFTVRASKSLQQTSISTLVANYFRLEVYADLAKISKDEPCIYSPLFIMKRDYKKIKGETKRPPTIREQDYNQKAKHQHFNAPDYWFKKNKNLEVMNFRLEDNITHHETENNFGY